jgi:hypothetical protein
MPKVSVVVPNYNHARFLRQRIESVLGQTFRDFEVILLDDCSTDESRSILSEYAADPRVKIEFNKKNSGSTFRQWNKGVQLAKGEFVWIAESDDYADKNLLERLVATLDAEPSIAFAYCRSWRVSAEDHLDGFADSYLNGRRWTANYCADGREECRNFFVVYNTIPNASAVLFRKDAYELVGGADESLRLCGDWKLWAAMALTGRVAYLGEPLNYFRFHDQSVRDTSGLILHALESLQLSRWLMKRITPSETAREKMCVRQATLWVPALMSVRVPFGLKWQILQEVRAIDRRPLRHAIRPALVTIRLKFARHLPFIRAVG